MERTTIRIGDLRFELVIPDDIEDLPVFEIENEASIVFEPLDVHKAIQLRNLLDDFIEAASDS